MAAALLSLLSTLLLIVMSVLTTLGNYWFTFGIWPRSWSWFIFFALCQLIITALLAAVGQLTKKAVRT